jgi:hypothetical protein
MEPGRQTTIRYLDVLVVDDDKAGFDVYLTKPVQPDELMGAVVGNRRSGPT